MALQVWMVGEDGEDLKNHKELLPLSKLQEIGVLYWHLDPKRPESEEELAKIRKDRGYNYMDHLNICPGKLADFEEKLKNFFTEHKHADEEIRYSLEGGGYFDVRDKDDKWVRIWIKEGDIIVLPAGIYHRFTLDAANQVKLMKLFLGEPVWTVHNRPQEDHPVWQEYVKRLTDDNAGGLAGAPWTSLLLANGKKRIGRSSRASCGRTTRLMYAFLSNMAYCTAAAVFGFLLTCTVFVGCNA
ncbi:hypothetical protein CFC21_018442 [Triticum aestivum]|uniref:Acireductone dioxygenase n=3 Tax=Triticum TaxID=4564 RepID=A0A9R1RBG0_TRITD|nr:1,2-dihydroxy-3-keto-5-methylthiopentene dioxygenase 4-like isoform X1 [Triticum aestivum]KAF7003061.1 hypothetical protein CFC21_018442 [Triticum aestivum]VAH35335.1 unnamed protein product [Triticum turgidum subsp. durum]